MAPRSGQDPDTDMTAVPHILVVDDHREIREPLARYLEKHGLRATQAADAGAARRVLAAGAVDLVVLDIMMPGEDGLSLCRHLRESANIPVILLTAMAEETDRIVGLELGADDYVTKPFNPRELMARIKAVLRRAHSLPPAPNALAADAIRFDRWTLHVARRELEGPDGVAVPLSTGEFNLLSAFLNHPRMVLSRDQLLDLTKGRDAAPFDRSIDNQVSRLRRKIESDPKNPELIRTVWGGGYTFSAEVRPS
jgi:two-component system, OmpR family, response regulator